MSFVEKASSVSVRMESNVDDKSKLESEKSAVNVKNVDDFLKLGLYTLYAGITCEFVVFNMLSNMIYMVYAGEICCICFYATTDDLPPRDLIK
ncbi:unnamed protein product [Toxocara canis]|uniref:Vesicle transport protein n=1 Tax=Toxocara canis TaxID=6265 RepID=A0A183VHM4_TOXCA|nr:unnamed protein product [Toxocara canis]